MSLQAWYPFNGNLENLGLGDLDLTVQTSPTYTTGKVTEQSLGMGNFYWTPEQSASVLNNQALSFSFWLKPTASTQPSQGIFGQQPSVSGRRFCIFTYPTLNDLHLDWRSSNGTVLFTETVWNGFFPINTWTHCAITYEYPNIVKIYRNGSLYRALTPKATLDITDFKYSTNLCGGIANRHINDFRVYDHCLSPKEVKEISKGLMLHYPLDNNGMGCKNLLAGNFNSIATKNGTNNTGSLWVNTASIPTGNLNYLIGKTLIFSYEVSAVGEGYLPRTSNLASRYGIHGCLQGSGTFQQYPFANYLHYTGGAKRVVMKYTIPTTMTSITNLTFALQATNYPAADNNATWYIKNCKLEIADEITPWCPNIIDELYSQLDMDENIEYDTSGYGNNGTKIGTLDYESSSPRYNVSSYFNGTDAYIKVPELALDMTNITFSMWYKPTGAINFARLFDFSAGTNGSATTFLIGHLSASMDLCIHGRYPNKTGIYATGDYVHNVTAGTWYHVVCTISGTTCKLYIDGKLVGTKTLTQSLGVVKFINNYLAESTFSADPLNKCNLSDFRIYSTCLSDSDIQELYNKPISIDNQGTMFAQDFNEEVMNTSHFKKNGIVKSTQIGEYLYNYFTYDNSSMQIQSVNSKVSLTKLSENNGFKLTCNSALSSEAMTRTQQLLFNGASGQFKVDFDAWATNTITIIPDICDKDSGTCVLTSNKQHYSGVANNVNSYNTSSAYNGFFDIKCSGTIPAGTEIYITNIVITKNTPKSIGSNYIVIDDIIEN